MNNNISVKMPTAARFFVMLMCAVFVMTSANFNKVLVYADTENGWQEIDGVFYWYENGVRQGYDPYDASYRGKEIYDPDSDAWYWLDNDAQGAAARSKDVYQESGAGIWGAVTDSDGNKTGKWVRYDENGHMIKGWNENENGRYYFDLTYGTMAKGYCTIDGTEYYFNTQTGVLVDTITDGLEGYTGWKEIYGQYIWYEEGIRQGYSLDASYRGKEIYDPDSDAWYWLDNILSGARAQSKDVYQESEAGIWGAEVNELGVSVGKWVRYDENGHMVKGWSQNENGTYYFDLTYGTMAKGQAEIDGKQLEFDVNTGVLLTPLYSEADKILLAAIIEWEADGEPYEGKLGVGYVVLNRVNSSSFGNDIQSVLLARNQFSGVANGSGGWSEKFAARINKYMAGLENECTLAATDVLMGYNYPFDADYLYFGTKLGNCSQYMKIGNHYFYNY